MAGSSHLSNFMPDRYAEIEAILRGYGFDVAWNTHPAYPNEWKDDPPLGLVRIKGVWLPNADTEADPDEDDRVTFSIMERWSEDEPDYSFQTRQGLWIAGYGYNGHIAGAYGPDGRDNHRHDFDPDKPSDLVFHLHPLGRINADRVPEEPVTLDEAIEDFLEQFDGLIRIGRFEP